MFSFKVDADAFELNCDEEVMKVMVGRLTTKGGGLLYCLRAMGGGWGLKPKRTPSLWL